MLSSNFDLEGFTQNPQCHSKHAESVKTIGSDKFSMHSLQVPLSTRFTIAKYFYSEDTQVKLPFMLRATYTIEGPVAKVLFKFEVDKQLKGRESERRNQHQLKAVKMPSFEQIQIKINFPTEVTEAALMSTHGSFNFSRKSGEENASGMWSMSDGPSLTESNGVATLEGKLRLSTHDSVQEGASVQSGKAVVQQTEFESAMTATVCLKIANYSLSGAKVENVHLQGRTG